MTDMQYVDAVMPVRTNRELPAGSCDTHNHVFGPFEQYPLEFPPDYAMPLAPAETYLRMLDLVGLERGVLLQPTQQAGRIDVMLDALASGAGRLRGVAAATPDTADAELERMAAGGIVGLRFVEAPTPAGTPRPGAVGFDSIADLATRMAGLGWSVNAWARMQTLMESLDKLLAPGLPLVIEHMGMLDPAEGPGGKGFQTLLALLREGRVWIKVSVCRCSVAAPGYEDLRLFVDAMIEANADRLLWGSDWPFIRMQGHEPDAGQLVDLLRDWVGDAAIERKILAENPARVYGFPLPQ